MKTLEVDYREFRLSRINQPRFRHLWLLTGWIGYFALYFLTENLIPAEVCYPVYSPLDDKIPFCEWFVLPYVGWYGLIVFSLGFFLLYDVKCFRQLQTYIIVTQVLAMAAYILFPTRQDLRPAVFPRENVLTDWVALLYAFDTNTGVCPSLHVAYSVGIASVWLRRKETGVLPKLLIAAFAAVICLSTAFIKQHSVVDIAAAVPVCVAAEAVVYGIPRLKKRNRDTDHF